MKSYTVNSVHDKTDFSHSNAVRGISGWAGSADEKFGWSIKVTQIKSPSNFIVMSEAPSFSNLLGFANGLSRSRGGYYSSSFSPLNLPAHNNDVGGIEGFYVHGVNGYKLNFLHGDGHVFFRSVPETLGEHSGNFYDCLWTTNGNLKNTDWNALH